MLTTPLQKERKPRLMHLSVLSMPLRDTFQCWDLYFCARILSFFVSFLSHWSSLAYLSTYVQNSLQQVLFISFFFTFKTAYFLPTLLPLSSSCCLFVCPPASHFYFYPIVCESVQSDSVSLSPNPFSSSLALSLTHAHIYLLY